VAGKSIW